MLFYCKTFKKRHSFIFITKIFNYRIMNFNFFFICYTMEHLRIYFFHSNNIRFRIFSIIKNRIQFVWIFLIYSKIFYFTKLARKLRSFQFECSHRNGCITHFCAIIAILLSSDEALQESKLLKLYDYYYCWLVLLVMWNELNFHRFVVGFWFMVYKDYIKLLLQSWVIILYQPTDIDGDYCCCFLCCIILKYIYVVDEVVFWSWNNVCIVIIITYIYFIWSWNLAGNMK